MSRFLLALGIVAFVAFVAAGCGSDDPAPLGDATTSAAGSCLVGDPDCDDTGGDIAAPPLADSIEVDDPDGPIAISFGGFFYADGETSRLCGALAESFPPQCASSIIEIVGSLELVLEHVAEAFGNPDDARINTDQGIWWTDEWVNISGLLEDGKLVVS